MEELKDRILGLSGMNHFINVMDDQGAGYVIALVESEEISNTNAENVKAIWGEFAEFLEEMPTPKGFDVLVSWTK
ncbi:hypothetical protein [Roseovarius sp. PS-C2]|uniref:hypothetical protein n=1 Tax=Roseovarius sp. PS-C2 TaxID=2820814 RepID=UPI00209B0719|nr:hypothetical protein [Roseovarius sp. PS-C2]